jgi:hypothetical protein
MRDSCDRVIEISECYSQSNLAVSVIPLSCDSIRKDNQL